MKRVAAVTGAVSATAVTLVELISVSWPSCRWWCSPPGIGALLGPPLSMLAASVALPA